MCLARQYGAQAREVTSQPLATGTRKTVPVPQEPARLPSPASLVLQVSPRMSPSLFHGVLEAWKRPSHGASPLLHQGA